MYKSLKTISFCIATLAFVSCNNTENKKSETSIEIEESDSTPGVDGTRVDDEYTAEVIADSTLSEEPSPEKEIKTNASSKKVAIPPAPPRPVTEKATNNEDKEMVDAVEEQVEVLSISLFFQEANDFFGKNVKNGKVNYAGIKSNPKQLNDLVELAMTSNPSSGNTYKAFYINTYNIMTIKGIVDAYPISSPLDVNGFFDAKKYNVAGEMLTLNDIENNKLRKQFNDARIHFVVVCGARSCPPIINQAYTASNVNSLMTRQAKSAVNADFFVKVDDTAKEVAVSMIMKWYKEDFVKDGQTEIDYLNKYRKIQIPTDYTLKYQEYNWKVNSQ